jgi:hypothetical protein
MQTSLGRFEYSLNVLDLPASIAFYEALGFERGGGDGRSWCEMVNGDLHLGLYQGHVSSNLLTFFTPQVAEIAGRLASAGVAVDQGPELEQDGSTGLTLSDPDGNRIYLNG